MSGGRLLRAWEVAERLGVSTETVLRWTRRGVLPALRLPSGAYRYPEAALDAWLAARATARPTIAPTIEAAPARRLDPPDRGLTTGGTSPMADSNASPAAVC